MPRIRIEIRDQRYEAELPDQVVTVGSAQGSGLQLACEGIAAEHFRLEPLPHGATLVRDAQSGMETRVNGYVVKQVTLGVGDVVTAGELRITLLSAEPAALDAVPEAAAPPEVAPPPRERAPRSPEPARASRGPVGAAVTASAPSTRAQSEPLSATSDLRRTVSTERRRLTPLFVVGGAVIAALIVLLSMSGGDAQQRERMDRLAAEADQAREDQKLLTARALYEALAKGGGKYQEHAEAGLQRLAATEFEISSELERLWAERMDLSAADFERRRERFVERFGLESGPPLAAMGERIVNAQQEWRESALSTLDREIDALIGAGRFCAAVQSCERVRKTAPLGIDLSEDFAQQVERIDVAAAQAAAQLLAETQVLEAEGRPDLAAGRLERALSGYVGLAPHAELVERMEAALRATAVAPAGVGPEPTTPNPRTEPAPGTAETPPTPVEPGVDPQAARLQAAHEAIAPLLLERRYGAAASALAQAAGGLEAGPARTKLDGEVQNLRDAALGLQALISDINTQPGRYTRIEVRPRLSVAVSAANEEALEARVSGGSMRYAWKNVPGATLSVLSERAQPQGAAAMHVAGLLHVAGETDAAAAYLFVAGSSGADLKEVFVRVARWRGEAVPEAGYVEYERRYVTVEEREHLLREAKIAAGVRRLNAREAKERAAALAELLEIGEPARERTREALARRRSFLESELATGKGYSGAKHKAKLLTLLEERRKYALDLIYDSQAYPYPNPNKQNQEEVERRVDGVRQIWERSFELVSQWDSDLQEGLALLSEADSALVRVDPSWRPDLASLSQKISAAIEVPPAADGELRAYSLKVQAYNETLPTSATEEEKDNVRIVNEYRMMMGLQAVRVEERLTRAARGHSRHMRENGYFAHDVPSDKGATAENRSPGARAKRQGYGSGVGENIARGPSTGRGAFWAWFGSSGHHRNMLGRGWFEMGCGRSGLSWWTQLFGGGSKSLKVPDPLPDPEPFYAPELTPSDGGNSGPPEVPDEPPPGEGD